LTDAGAEQARAVVQALLERGELARPEAIWHSPYVRTTQTAAIAAEVLGAGKPVSVPELASGSMLIRSLAKYLDPAQAPSSLLVVGHMPDLGDLVSHLVGKHSGAYGLGRAGTARLTGEFKPGGMQLEWLRTAD